MRLPPGFPLAFVLAVLLFGTTPVGTGAGSHQFDLVHPLFSHVHIVNGRIVLHDQQQADGRAWSASRPTSPGPALGAGPAATQASFGVGIGPNVPMSGLGLVASPDLRRRAIALHPPIGRLQESPPDPPPTSAA